MAWAAETSAPDTAEGSACFVLADKFYVLGGFSNPGQKMMVYDPSAGTWTYRTTVAPAHFSSAAVVGGVVYLFTGFAPNGPLGDYALEPAYVYDTVADTYTAQTAVSPLLGEDDSSVSVIGTTVWRLNRPNVGGEASKQLVGYHTGTDSYTLSAAPPWAHNIWFNWTATDGTYVYVQLGQAADVGGAPGEGDLYRYDPGADTWSALTTNTVTPAQSQFAICTAGKIYTFGGYSDAAAAVVAKVGVYDIVGGTWSDFGADLPVALYSVSGGMLSDGSFLVAGGDDATNSAQSTLYRYTSGPPAPNGDPKIELAAIALARAAATMLPKVSTEPEPLP